MSAIPKIEPPKKVRPKAFYAGKTGAQVRAMIRQQGKTWTGYGLRADLFRISKGLCQAAFLQCVYYHTDGLPHAGSSKRWKAPEYSKVLIPQDWGRECNYSKEEMIEAVADAVSRGMAGRKCGCTQPKVHCGSLEHYQFKLLQDDWPAMPNRFAQRIPNPKDESDENIDGYDESQCLAGHRESILPRKKVAFVAGGRYDLDRVKVEAIQYNVPEPLSAQFEAGVLHINPGEATKKKGKGQLVEMPEPKAAPEKPADPPQPKSAVSKKAVPPPPPAPPAKKPNPATVTVVAPESIDLNAFPNSMAWWKLRFAGTTDNIWQQVISLSIQEVAKAGEDVTTVRDKTLLMAMNACVKPDQRNGALFCRTVPKWFHDMATLDADRAGRRS